MGDVLDKEKCPYIYEKDLISGGGGSFDAEVKMNDNSTKTNNVF